jgi:hypothetical protein
VQKHRALHEPTLLAVGDPNFQLANAPVPPRPPEYGLHLSLVLPGSNAGRHGLRGGDVLLSYNSIRLSTKDDLKLVTEGAAVPVEVWRHGKTLEELRRDPGKLGVVISEEPPAVALRKRCELELLADARVRSGVQPLPGTRLEVAAVTALLPKGRTTLLLGSNASEQRPDGLTAAGKAGLTAGANRTKRARWLLLMGRAISSRSGFCEEGGEFGSPLHRPQVVLGERVKPLLDRAGRLRPFRHERGGPGLGNLPAPEGCLECFLELRRTFRLLHAAQKVSPFSREVGPVIHGHPAIRIFSEECLD